MQCVDLHGTGNSLRRWEPYVPSAPTGSIVGTQQGGLYGDQLLEARRAIAHAVGEPPEISDGIVKTFVEAQATQGIGANGSLHGAEEAPCTWKRNRHGAQLAQEPVRRVQGQAFLAGVNGVQEGREALLAPWRQFQGHRNSVDDHSEDLLPGFPACVTFFSLSTEMGSRR
jgi:hypothetical protein